MRRKAFLTITITMLLSACDIGANMGPTTGFGFGCGSGCGANKPYAWTLTPSTDQIVVIGDTLTITLLRPYGTGDVRWESSSPAITLGEQVTVYAASSSISTAKLRADGYGQTLITALAEGRSASRSVRVIPLMDVRSVRILTRDAVVREGSSVEMVATVSDLRGDAVDSKPRFSVSDTTIAIATYEAGVFDNRLHQVIRGLRAGRVMVHATLGNAADSVEVTISP